MQTSRGKQISSYDLRDRYAENMGRALGVATDWEVLGFFHKLPAEYHFTKKGQPDKRYSNYPEVDAYWNAELEERAKMIEASQL